MNDSDPPKRTGSDGGKGYFRPDRRAAKKRRRLKPTAVRWIITVTGWTFVISLLLSLISNTVISGLGVLSAMAVLLMFILLGIVFDILGVAVATASEKPFHSMAARRVRGAEQSLRLVRNTEKVSSFCNDVVGDISGIISGATTTVIATTLIQNYGLHVLATTMIFSAVVASLTVGGKALGKTVAVRNNTAIIHVVGTAMSYASGFLTKLRQIGRHRD